MKIVQINVTYGTADSTGRSVKELHEYLRQCGHNSYVFTTTLNDTSRQDSHVYLFSSKTDKKIHALLSRLLGRQGFFSKQSTKKLIRQLENIKPDVVLLHVLHSNCINFPLLFEYLAQQDIPTVLVVHDCWYYTGHCCHYTDTNCFKWQKKCGHCPAIRTWNKSWFFDYSAENLLAKDGWYKKMPNLAIISVSKWLLGEIKKSILKKIPTQKYIYNWIDLSVFEPKDVSKLREKLHIKANEKILLGVASSWDDRKGFQEIIEVAKVLPEAKIIIVGNTPSHLAYPTNILRVGTIKQPDILSQYYNLADLFLNPSAQETFGKTTAEALGCGTPVVVYNTTACPELVGEKCGIIVQDKHPSSFVQVVVNWYKNPNTFSKKFIRKYALTKFSKKKNLEKYEKMLINFVKFSTTKTNKRKNG